MSDKEGPQPPINGRELAEVLGIEDIDHFIERVREQAQKGAKNTGEQGESNAWAFEDWQNYINRMINTIKDYQFTPEEIARFKRAVAEITQEKFKNNEFLDKK